MENSGINSKKTPYKGLLIFLPMMVLPSILVTGVLYLAIMKWQPQFGLELNWATAKAIGCGCGVLFHFGCWLMGTFAEDFQAVKIRLKEFFTNIAVSARLAFSCYWEDIKTLGIVFWIDLAVIALNAGIFIDAILDYLTLRGSI